VRPEESETPSNAGTNDGYGELDGSPLMDRIREFACLNEFMQEALGSGVIGVIRLVVELG
jgi:hypothetical protein